MRVQFINAVLGDDFSAMDIGTTAVATYINERTLHQARITDLVFHRRQWREHLVRDLTRWHPHWVAMSTTTLYMPFVKAVVTEIRRHFPLPLFPIILGGHHASVHPEETILLADAVCIGDGERPLSNLLDAWESGEQRDTPGIWHRRGEEIIRNPGGRFEPDIDSLPIPNWDLWADLDSYLYFLGGLVYMVGSRGCPYRCSFCDALGIAESVPGQFYRERNPEAFAQEIVTQYHRLKHRGARLAQLFDPVFTLKRQWLERFSAEYIRLGKPLPFSCFSRIDNLDEDKVRLLAEAGCAIIRTGVESGDEHIRQEVYNKRISDRAVYDVVAMCHRQGIALTNYFILGGPAETRKTLTRTLAMAQRLRAARTAFFVYKPCSKDAEALLQRHGSWVDSRRAEKADNISFGATIASKELSPRYVEWFQRWAYLLTFGRRLLRIALRYRFAYLWWLASYLRRGLRHGLSLKYLMMYFHIYYGPLIRE